MDDEYIDKIRRRVAVSKRRALCHILIGSVALAGFLVMNTWTYCLLRGDMAGIPLGVAIGCMLGIMLGMVVVFAGWNLYVGTSAWKGFRVERLLLEYHDELERSKPERVDGEGLGSAGAPPSPSS